ncbi:MAG: HAD-IA family hydrolase [Nanoarchaeota archaeon]|nr:HAD-IA family hydrolase [Nanoarchaeota archaeon]
MEKVILVDAWNTLVTEEGMFQEMKEMLDHFENKKVILTNANEEEKIKYGIIDMPYEVFTLSHNPNKTNPEYYKKMLEHFGLNPENVIYFEHNAEAVESAKSIGIKTFHYDKDKKDLDSIKEFLESNLNQF